MDASVRINVTSTVQKESVIQMMDHALMGVNQVGLDSTVIIHVHVLVMNVISLTLLFVILVR